MSEYNRRLIEEFRASGGKVGGPYEGAPLLLLTTIGAKSGRPHTTPLIYLEDSGLQVVFGTKGGAPTHPAWYYNLLARPEARVELGTRTFVVEARLARGGERERLVSIQASRRREFAEYEATMTRTIPVFVLERRD